MSHNLVRRKKTTSLDVNKINMFQFRYLCYFPCFGSAILGGFFLQRGGEGKMRREQSLPTLITRVVVSIIKLL